MTYTNLQNFNTIIFEPDMVKNVFLLTNICTFWKTNKDFWFSHKPISSWPIAILRFDQSKYTYISFILHYDQIYRHPNPLLNEYQKQKAYRFATYCALHILHSGKFSECEDWEKVFVLLCLRHNKSLLLKELALKKALKEAEESPSQLWIRFLNATIWDIHEFKYTQFGYPPEKLVSNTKMLQTFDSILERPKKTLNYDHKKAFEHLYQVYYKIIKSISSKRIAVSISGGVDSMVAAYIANKVCNKFGTELVLLHICYNNRDECEDELNLLRWFSQELERPLYIRSITEMKRIRTSDLRSLYEDITRRIRFSFYAHFECPVVLGHNLDDTYENIFANLGKQIHFDNLFGMTEVKVEQGVTILRPMLEIPKKDIVAFADHTDIPHLYDSTPKWSRRGQMRDVLIPAISSFDPAILEGLRQYVNHTTFLESQWNLAFSSWIRELKESDGQIQIPRDGFFSKNYATLNFWIQLWTGLKLLGRPSNKSFQNLIERISAEPPAGSRCVLSSAYRIVFGNEALTLHSGLHCSLHEARSEST